MIDSEIIKALECCSKPYCADNKCPLYENTTNTKDCITQLSTNALDIINRQKAEIESLYRCIESQEKTLKAFREPFIEELKELKEVTIKDFAERLKSKKQEVLTSVNVSEYAVTESNIDNLVKEMTEENQNE